MMPSAEAQNSSFGLGPRPFIGYSDFWLNDEELAIREEFEHLERAFAGELGVVGDTLVAVYLAAWANSPDDLGTSLDVLLVEGATRFPIHSSRVQETWARQAEDAIADVLAHDDEEDPWL